jgi:hypothetical protein
MSNSRSKTMQVAPFFSGLFFLCEVGRWKMFMPDTTAGVTVISYIRVYTDTRTRSCSWAFIFVTNGPRSQIIQYAWYEFQMLPPAQSVVLLHTITLPLQEMHCWMKGILRSPPNIMCCKCTWNCSSSFIQQVRALFTILLVIIEHIKWHSYMIQMQWPLTSLEVTRRMISEIRLVNCLLNYQ